MVAGQVANENSGPAIIFSFLIAAFSALLSAFCYSEYAVRVPLSGSAFTFSYVTLGEFIGWLYVSFSFFYFPFFFLILLSIYHTFINS